MLSWISTAELAALVGVRYCVIDNELRRKALPFPNTGRGERKWTEQDVAWMVIYLSSRKILPWRRLQQKVAQEVAEHYVKSGYPNRYIVTKSATWCAVSPSATIHDIERMLGTFQQQYMIVRMSKIKQKFWMPERHSIEA